MKTNAMGVDVDRRYDPGLERVYVLMDLAQMLIRDVSCRSWNVCD